MSGFRNNAAGILLVSAGGALLLISLVMALVWSGPPSASLPEGADAADGTAPSARGLSELEPLSAYREVTDRPIFEETRRPAVTLEENSDEQVDEVVAEIADAPKVRLTGVVITPEQRLVTLSPESGGEPLLLREGTAMEDDYAGWQVSRIEPRRAILSSRNGEELALDLQVHNATIAEPPKSAPATPRPGDADEGTAGIDEEDGPLTRAEQIRQRIAERREELRRQQELQDREAASRPSSSNSPLQSDYMKAISGMVNRNQQTADDNDENDDKGNDKDNE